MKFAGILAALGMACLGGAVLIGVSLIADWMVIAAEALLFGAGAVVLSYVALGFIADIVLEG
jgi:hypothetical protein